MRLAIDQTYLSPSGRVSKRARELAQERVRRELFGDGLRYPALPKQPTEREYLLRKASQLRELARNGMKQKAYTKEATRLESKAAGLSK